MKKTKGSSLAVGIILIIIALIMISQSNLLSFTGGVTNSTIQPLGNQSSATILSLSHVQLYSQSSQLSGLNWLATIVLNNGNQNLYITPSELNNATPSIFASKASTFAFSIKNQKILYPIASSTGYTAEIYGAAAYQGQVAYQDCNGNMEYPSGSQTQYFSCIFNNQQGFQNYINSCLNDSIQGKTNLGTTLPVSLSTTINIPWIFNLQINNAGYQCWYIYQHPYGTIIEPQSPTIWQDVAGSVNGQQLEVNNANPISQSSNWQLRLLNPSYTAQSVPSTGDIGTVIFTYNSSGTHEFLISQTPLSSFKDVYAAANMTIGHMYSNISQYGEIPTLNGLEYYVGFVDGLYKNYTTKLPLSYNNNPISLNSSYIILGDNNSVYAHPALQVLVNVSYMGIYIPVSNFSITGTKAAVVRSSSINTTYITIKNVGQVQGSAQVSASCISNPCYISFTGVQSQGSQNLAVGQSQTLGFVIAGVYNNQSSYQSIVQFKVCSSANNCEVANATETTEPVCTGTAIYNSGNCVSQSNVNQPSTTSIQGRTTIGLGNSTTTASSIICPIGQVLNQSTQTCVYPPNGGGNSGSSIGWIVVIAAVAIIAALLLGRKRGKK